VTTRRVCFVLDEDLRDRAQQAANADHRSLANWLAVTVERALDISADLAAERQIIAERRSGSGGQSAPRP
jgi:hypothetical protein